MIKDLVLNVTLLISSFSVLGQVFRNNPLLSTSNVKTKLYWGLNYGILGNILMLVSIKINATTIADLRHLAIVIPAVFGGFIPALTAAVLIAIGRILLFGYNETALFAAISALLIGIICGIISRIKLNQTLKAFFMNLIGILIFSVVFIFNIDDHLLLKNLLIAHSTISLIGGFFTFHFAVYITNLIEAQQQLKLNVIKLKETEERFRLLAEFSSDMITMHNEDSEFIYISPAVKEIIKYEYPELLGKKIEEFIHPDDISHAKAMFAKALNEGFAASTHRFRRKIGDYVWIESTLKSVDNQELGSKRVINVSRNITDRKLTEHKLQEANQLLSRLSYMDGLTGIANRRFFDETLEKEWPLLTNAPLTLIMFDIDYFKKFNDTYGHLEGDHCLQAIAKAISQQVSNFTTFTFCRYGGEEFALILPFTDLEKGMQIAHLVQKAVQSLKIPHKSSEIADIITLSIGVAMVLPNHSSKPKDLIQKADSALYLSKTKGRNTISIE